MLRESLLLVGSSSRRYIHVFSLRSVFSFLSRGSRGPLALISFHRSDSLNLLIRLAASLVNVCIIFHLLSVTVRVLFVEACLVCEYRIP